jgi:PelA/Pel-15E family pectate lyase
MKMRSPLVALLGLLLAAPCFGRSAPSFVSRDDAWFSSDEGKQVVSNILSWQFPTGGWPKAYDANKHNEGPIHVVPHQPATTEARAAVAAAGDTSWDIATFDNDATHSELRILARAVTLTHNEEAKVGFFKGMDAVLRAQYPSGGWPQRFPPQDNYGKHITFNDGAMIGIMEVLQDAAKGEGSYAFVDEARRAKCKQAVEKGIDCILKCQIVVNGKLTGWCAQHDEVTLAPAKARAYELPSISGSEGGQIAIFLMQIPHPDERVKKAVEGAAEWFASSVITGKRVTGARTPEGLPDRVLVDDPTSTIWARFYDLETNKPIFSGRDSVKKYALADIEQERRAGYSWYGPWGHTVANEYKKWKKANGM